MTDINKAMAFPKWCLEAAKRIANCGLKRDVALVRNAYFDLACEFYDSIIKASTNRDQRIEIFSGYWKKRQKEPGFPENIRKSSEAGICDALFLLPGFEAVVEQGDFDTLLTCAVYAADWGKKLSTASIPLV